MNSKFQEIANRLPSATIHTGTDCTIVNGPGGCNFVVDPEKPHLGGNLIGETPHPSLPNILWPWLLETFNPKTFLDVGCAEGNAIAWFKNHGVTAAGFDGLARNVQICRNKGLHCVEHDLTTSPYLLLGSIDMIWCSDVVEHIEEQFLPNIFKTFQYAKTLVIAHGLEDNGPTGWHHVTNKPHQYWIDNIERYGFKYEPELSEQSRKMCGEGWYFLSGKIFRRLY